MSTKTYQELDAHKRELQRKRQQMLDAGKNVVLINKSISKAQREMNTTKDVMPCADYA